MRTLSLLTLSASLALAACKPPAPAATAARTADGLPLKEIAVTEHGFDPNRVDVDAGRPVVLRFTRKTPDTCGEAVKIAGDPVTHMLPVNRPVDVKVTAPKAGELAFACGMEMMHGVLVAR
jgi:Cu+-exporting ATPase